jgi:cytochrome c2
MVRRLITWALIAVVAFSWGVTTGLHRTFPWGYFEPVQRSVTALLWMSGIVPLPAELLPDPPQEQRVALRVDSGLLNFDGWIVNNGAPIAGTSGAIALTERGVLVARENDGAVWFYDPATDTIQKTVLQLPPTFAEEMPARTATGRDVPRNGLRYHDIELADRADGVHLLVSLTRFDSDRQCFALELHDALLPAGWDRSEAPVAVWNRLFEATPCLPFADDRNVIGGNQAGGRIIIAGEEIYLSTGDFEFDGIDSKSPPVSQQPGSTLGRIMKIGWDGSAVEISRGHRNPQGLAMLDGQLWETEHGPMGGDELNLIVPGADYGWPTVTLGVNYTEGSSDTKFWPNSARPGRHDSYRTPVYAWLPSIAPSAIIAVTGLHERWEGDLLVASLAAQALHRLRVEDGRIVYDERIALGGRVRDIGIAGGRLYFLLDDGRFGYLTPRAMADQGSIASASHEALTQNGCVVCHSNPSVPRLAGSFEADIASQTDVAYSDALKAVEGTWTREALRAFLASPEAFAAGTTMPNPYLTPMALALDAVISELKQLKR